MKKLISIFFLLQLCHFIYGQPTLEYVQLTSGLDEPLSITNAGDGSNRLFITEKDGIIRIVENGTLLSTPFLYLQDISSISERGLLGLAFHPNYKVNGYFYVNYINSSGDTKISRFEVDSNFPNIGDLNSEKVLMTIAQPYSNNNGGDMAFNPIDNYLYIPMGDGGAGADPGCRSQDSTLLFGKILRIDVDQNMNIAPYYGIPTDNPFINLSNVPDEIWALGLRNPLNFSFDSKGHWQPKTITTARRSRNYTCLFGSHIFYE